MRRLGLVALLALGVLVASCDENGLPRTQYSFSGFVYDGLTGATVMDYELTLYWANKSMRAKIDKNGRYFVGPMDAEHEHQVEIIANGYRMLRSSNEDLSEDGPAEVNDRFKNNKMTLIRDAFVWPVGATAQEGQINVFFNDSTDRPDDGFVRLFPDDDSSNLLDGETPEGEWEDDAEDIAPAVVLEIVEGVAMVPEGSLILGVDYEVVVYGVPGYEVEDDEDSFDAGEDGVVDIFLSPLDDEDLELVELDDGTAPQGGPYEVVFLFNQPIELCTVDSPREVQEEDLDDGLSLSVDDFVDGDTDTSVVHDDPAVDDEDDEQENGTSISISGAALTISWNGDVFEGPDAENDVITRVRWNNMNDIDVQPVGEPDDCDDLQDLNDDDSDVDVEVAVE